MLHFSLLCVFRAKLQRVSVSFPSFIRRGGLRSDAGGVFIVARLPQRGRHVCGAGRPSVSERRQLRCGGEASFVFVFSWRTFFFYLWPPSVLFFLIIPLFDLLHPWFCPPCPSSLQVPLPKEQKQRFRGVQHIHRETPVHREGPPLRPASTKLYLVSAAGSGRVRQSCWLSSLSTVNKNIHVQ